MLQEVTLDPKGNPRKTNKMHPLESEPAPTVRWNNGILGTAEFTYPHPQGWVVQCGNHQLTLNQLSVKHLTTYFRNSLERTPTCMVTWPRRLETYDLPWYTIASKLLNPLLTTRDYFSWYKNILHNRMMTRTIKPKEGHSTCRLCAAAYENTLHLARCPVLFAHFHVFTQLCTQVLGTQYWHSPHLILLGCYQSQGATHALPKGLYALFLIMWKFIIIEFTLVDTQDIKFNSKSVWTRTLLRFLERCNALEYGYRITKSKAEGKGAHPPSTRRIDAALTPLAHLDENGHLSYNHHISKLIEIYLPNQSLTQTEESLTIQPTPLRPIPFIKSSE